MSSEYLYVLSAYLRKWSYKDNRFTVNYTFCLNGSYYRKHVDLRIGRSDVLVSQLLNDVVQQARENNAAESFTIYNENDLKQKLDHFFKKIVKEFRNNKQNRKTRMISTRSIDFFYNDHDYEQLDDTIRFFVHLNRGMNKVSGDLWDQAIEDFKHALKYDPEDITVNKYLAMAYNKAGRFQDAVEPLQKYADAENSAEALSSLAMAYINLEEYDKADAIYQQIAENFGDALTANFGRAQIAYKKGADYMPYLEAADNEDPAWTAAKVRDDWEYKLPSVDEKNMWNAATAARYLGFERPFDLTRKAFNESLPCYFDEDKGTIRFVKEELDCWTKLNNRFNLDDQTYKTHEERLTEKEKQTN